MLINYVPGEECRIAFAKDGVLDEFYQERASIESHVGNIYKGRVTNVEPSIQAAFIDFGLERNGFLHISDLHPKYFPGKDKEEFEQVGSKTPRRDRPPIQKCLKRGQEILVQVLKEGIGTKGPTLTSYLSIPGRFVVMMPDMQRMGVSRKVEDEDARRNMKRILQDLKPPQGFGFIVRTAGIGQTKTDLKRDLAYLARLWKSIEKRKKAIRNVGELYAESDLVIRTIRDVFSNDVSRIVIDDLTAAKRARDFLAVANPRTKAKVVYYHDPVPLYHRFGIEEQIEQINAREVFLPSGGALVFDQAEALVAIDVNSGKSRDAQDAESNAFNTNMEAVDEICRQLKLRDLGGLVVNDLIDMRESKHRRKIEARFRKNLKNDRARSRINPISQFGMLEMTRQRMRPSLKKSFYNECPHCSGTGHIKTAETVVLEVMRHLAMVMHYKKVARVELTISPDVAFQLLNRKRSQLVLLEKKLGKPVMVRVGGEQIDYVEVKAFDDRKVALNLETLCNNKQIAKPTETTFIDLAINEIPLLEEETETANEYEEIESEVAELVTEQETRKAEAASADMEEGSSTKRRRRRRGSRGKRKHTDDNDDKQKNESAAKPDSNVTSESSKQKSENQSKENEAKQEQKKNTSSEAPKRTKSSRKRRSSKRTSEPQTEDKSVKKITKRKVVRKKSSAKKTSAKSTETKLKQAEQSQTTERRRAEDVAAEAALKREKQSSAAAAKSTNGDSGEVKKSVKKKPIRRKRPVHKVVTSSDNIRELPQVKHKTLPPKQTKTTKQTKQTKRVTNKPQTKQPVQKSVGYTNTSSGYSNKLLKRDS